MNSKAYFYVICLAALSVIAAPQTVQAFPSSAGGLRTVPLALCQTTAGDHASGKKEAERLLRLARQAMNRGEFDSAERYIVQAERLNVKYEPLYERFMDTPAKARKTLLELRGGSVASPVSPASYTSSSAPAATPPANTADPLSMITGDPKAMATVYLQKGRQALQQGNIAAAVDFRQKAIDTGVRFAPSEYSPDTLGADLRMAGVSEAQLAPAARMASTVAPGDFQGDRQRWMPTPPVTSETDMERSAMRDRAITTPEQLADEGYRPGSSYGAPAPSMLSNSGAEPRRLPPAPGAEGSPEKREVQRLLATAKAALDRGDAVTADQLARQAARLGVPDSEYAPGELRPEHLQLEINSSLMRQQNGVSTAGYDATPAYATDQTDPNAYPVRQGYYNPSADASRNMPAAAVQPAAPVLGAPVASGSTGKQLYDQGIRALETQQRDKALELFSQAWQYETELDPLTRQALRDKLTLLRAAPAPPLAAPGSPLEEVNSQQDLLRQKVFRDVTRTQSQAEQMRQNDPRGSLAKLQDLRRQVEQEQLDPPTRTQMLTLVDRSIREAELYIETNRSDIELHERNEMVVDDINRERQAKLDIQDKLAELLEQFNNLIDEQRYAEAEVLAKQAKELAPDSEVVQGMLLNSQMAHRVREQQMIYEMKEEGVVGMLGSVDESSIPYDDRLPLQYGDAKAWTDISSSRIEWLRQQHTRLTPAEQIIQESLTTKVDVRFDNQPLAEVMDTLGRMAGVNVYLDPEGLRAEGVTTDEPITVNLTQPISLRSALNLILEPLRLSYVIQNEVLRITSEQTRDSDVYPRVYNVADLVIPIPNFMPSYNIGLPGALREAVNSLGYGQRLDTSQPIPLTFASADAGNGNSLNNASVLAQMGSSGMLPTASPRSSSQMQGMLPGSLGGASMADFDTLIELITSTIAPTTWDTVGGPGSVEGFPTNLSLVVSQTQEVHEQIADLLDQLRRLQDLQVTIEVRYITLNDRFFERIGIDFDFNVDDNSNQVAGQAPVVPDDTGPSIAFGLDPTGQPTVDYDYSFTQDSFASTIPQFGGFDASTAANVGFALLSDIEVYFLLQAAQGDDRTNVLQAPKVTLFNGQTGFVSDTSQRPFVTSVIPVVGDFAAAHQPVVVVLSEGTSLSVQAVVSPDRRFVRLTLIPFFSSIGDVSTFTFNGRRSSNSGTNVVDPANQGQAVQDNQQEIIEGTTVQLPTFNFTTVSTTVSVPDGGTVLLGGIKRLSEGRNERGVPMLSKLPYINRLFKNVGIGRDTQSLMMMVTPRIIIQEEEEFLQTGYDSSQN